MDINGKIMGLYNDPIYQELNEYYCKTTIFNIFGIERNENRHSSFLRWLLDNRSSHGLGDEPIKKLLRLYASKLNANDANYDDWELQVMLMSGNYTINITKLTTEEPIKKTSKNTNGRIDIYGEMTLVNEDSSEDRERKIVLAIENKIYSGEGVDQTKDYHTFIKNKLEEGESAVEIFLTPKGSKKPEAEKFFKHITYPELLTNVIQPISKMSMPTETFNLIYDFIRNLGQPSTNEDGKDYSIIATSEDEEKKLQQLYDNNKTLYTLALIAGNRTKIIKAIEKVDNFRNLVKYLVGAGIYDYEGRIDKLTWKECNDILEEFYDYDEELKLEALWNANELLFKAILILEKAKDDLANMVNTHNLFRNSHRHTTKYNVTINGKPYGGNKALFKNRTALAIFKAYVELHPAVTLKELRERFPCNEINKYYSGSFYKYMFYDVEERYSLKFDVDHPKLRTNEEGKSGDVGVWDFFVDESDLLQLSNGCCEAMVVKMWRKNDFDRLVKYAERYGIIVTPAE